MPKIGENFQEKWKYLKYHVTKDCIVALGANNE